MERPEHDFHVVENEIVIDFMVPLPARGNDDVLTDLLKHHALEIIRDRKHRGQPLDGIPTARITALRSGSSEDIAVLDLDQPEGDLLIDLPELLPSRLASGYDLLARFGRGDEAATLPLAARDRGDDLRPLAEEVRLTAGLSAGLRAMGIDPDEMTMNEFGPGLLRLAGYEMTDRGRDTYVALGNGSSTFVKVVEHQPGDYPELAEQQVNTFLIEYASARTDRAMLLTDKYGPYLIYAKERVNPETLFVVRERLQAFVDAVALS